MKIVGRPVCGWRFVESPPMSQRSHIASSGSTAICVCSAACSAPSSASGGNSEASSPASSSYHSACVENDVRRQVERLQVDHLVVGQPLALVGEHLLGDA